MLLAARANLRQGGHEVEDLVVLGLVANGAERVVVALLLAPLRVPAGGVDVEVALCAHADAASGREDGQHTDAIQRERVRDALALVVYVAEARVLALAGDPRLRVVHVAQTCQARSLHGVLAGILDRHEREGSWHFGNSQQTLYQAPRPPR